MTTESLSLFAANSRTVTANTRDVFDIALVPRNTRGTILRVLVSFLLTPSFTANHKLAILIHPWEVSGVAKTTFVAINDWHSLDPIFVGMIGSTQTGSPTNTMILSPFLNVEVDLSKLKRRGIKVLSKGTRSNERAGWSMSVVDLDNQDTTYNMAIASEVELEWLGGKGSQKNLNIEYSGFDEEENT